jgi:glutamate-1-semialdehyde 2,1-aminomutase
MPVGAYGGKKEIMDFVSPSGPVYQAGTLSGNPIAMTAGLSLLYFLHTHEEVYSSLDKMGGFISEGIKDSLAKLGLPYTLNQIGSMYTLFFTPTQVANFSDAKTCDTAKFGLYFQAMLKRGIYLAPSQFESLFISTAITEEIAEKIIKASHASLVEIH